MKSVQYTITDSFGIHARPAGVLAKTAAEFKSDIVVATATKEVDARRVMGIMSLGVKKGDVIKVIASGADEAAAIAKLTQFLKENL